MMNLHSNPQLFKNIIDHASEDLKINPILIEKDYYVTLLLIEIFKIQPNYVFKGGTSLSKCYKIINRFSEDIDVNYLDHSELARSKKKYGRYY